LVARCQAGDPEAWRLLIEKHQRRVYNLAANFLGPGQEVEDLAQEIFIAMYRSLPSFRGEAQFTTWLYRLAVNVCLNACRRQPPPTVPLEAAESSLTAELAQLADPGPTPLQAVLSREAAALVRAKIAELPAHYRLAVVLCDLEGLSYEEIARIMRVSLGTVKSRVHRGRALLKEKLADYFEP